MRAFSLIETMVVVGILGIVAAIAVPNLVPEVHKAQLNGAGEAVANFIARTRTEAMASKRCTRILVTATRLTAQRINSFNCDATAPAERIDNTQPAFITIDTLKAESPSLAFTLQLTPTTPGGELRFRPNGRVFSNDALANVPVLNNDTAILQVTHAKLPAAANFRRILVVGNGLICAFKRGAVPAGPPFNCPL